MAIANPTATPRPAATNTPAPQAAQPPPVACRGTAVIIQRGTQGTVADAYVWESEPDDGHNYETLYTELYGTGRKQTLLRFDLEEIPRNAEVVSAVLRIHSAGSEEPRTVLLHRITRDWEEDGVTWQNFENAFDEKETWRKFDARGAGWKVADVSGLVQAWVNGTHSNYGLLLDDTDAKEPDTYETYSASETQAVEMRPRLEVCYVPPSPGTSIEMPPKAPLAPHAISLDNVDKLTQLAVLDKGPAKALAFSPDGSLLAIGSGNIYLYDMATKAEVGEIDAGGWVFSLAFSPDGKLLASAGHGGVRLWAVDGGGELRTLAKANDAKGVAFSPDGSSLAVAMGMAIKLFDVQGGQALRTIVGHKSTVGCVAFSPDGQMLASGSLGWAELKLWDVASGRELRTLTGHQQSINQVAFSPDGSLLASASTDGRVGVWDVATGRQAKALGGHNGQVQSVAFSPDRRLLASGSWDLTVKLWDVGQQIELRTLTGHTQWLQSVAFSPDGAILATGANDQSVILWGVAQ